MSTFLELCRYVAKESGTVPGENRPASVLNQVGREGKIVRWTNNAYHWVQLQQPAWRWLQGEFTGPTIAGTQRYTITRMAQLRYPLDDIANQWTIYKTSLGLTDVGRMIFLEWDEFYSHKLRGVQESGRPSYFTLSPNNEIVLYPIPDATYTMRGIYIKTPQALVENTDVPEMPERFHEIIKWKALLYLGADDESVVQLPMWRMELMQMMSALEDSQLSFGLGWETLA